MPPAGRAHAAGEARVAARRPSFLRQRASFDDLDRAAAEQSDLQAARSLNRARDELFRNIHGIVPAAA